MTVPFKASAAKAGTLVRRAFGISAALMVAALALPGCSGGPLNRLNAHLDMKKGNQSYLNGDYESAIQRYKDAVARVPTLPDPWLNEAYSYVAMSQKETAIEERRRLASLAVDAFQKYLDLIRNQPPGKDSDMPDRDRVEQHILTLYLDTGQPDKAVEFLEARLEQNHGQDLPALQMLSTISADRGDLVTAVKWQRKRLEVQPNNPEAHYAFGVFAWRASYYNQTTSAALRDSLLNEGVAELQKALQLQPNYFEALSYMSLLYREKAKNATNPVEAATDQAKANEYRQRAMDVRKQAGHTVPGEPAGTTPTVAPGAMVGAR